MNQVQLKSEHKSSSESVEGSGSGSKKGEYVPGAVSGKWTAEEHLRYIVFIDGNKDKMRSKQKRHSNKFYAQMAKFIGTRNALQCRSHHQKLEEKYTHPHKIVAFYKHAYEKKEYKEIMLQLTQPELFEHEFNMQKPTMFHLTQPLTNEAQTQTDIMGINLQFTMISGSTVTIATPFQQPQQFPQQSLFQPFPAFMGNGFRWWGHHYPHSF